MARSDLVFFLSGAAALAYEVLWGRMLARLLGGDAEGAAVVLALFMTGLGAGAVLFAARAATTRRPRAWFAAVELGVALWATLSPWMLSLAGAETGTPGRLAVAALAVLPASLGMGATFPLMGRLAIAARDAAGRSTAAFYGANTLGACAGALLAPTLLLPWLGLRLGLGGAALLDVVAAGLVWSLPEPRRAPAPAEPASILPWRLALPPFLLGFTGLALEVIATRLLVSVTGATVYAFAIVLAVFLLGLGLGSRQAAGPLDRPGGGERLLARCAALTPALALLGLLLLRWQLGERDLFGILANRQPAWAGTWKLWASHALFAALALLPVTFAFGMALPAAVAVALHERPRARTEDVLGGVYLANTAGALLGSLAAGFVLVPLAGPRLGLTLALVPALLAAGVVPRARPGLLGLGLLLALGAGTLALAPGRAARGPDRLALLPGRNATVSVEESVEADGARVRSLRVNGKVEATTAPVDMRLQRLLGLLPGVLHGEVRTALVIGLGTGMTAGSLLELPTLERLDVFEIEGRIPRAARLFAGWNGDLLDDPRVHVTLADGRLELERSPRRFDLITADPLHPATRGSSDLFSLEHFRSMAAHLAPGGVASQWLPLYELSSLDVRTVVATWTRAFPHTSAWLTAYDLALVGSNEPLSPDGLPAALPDAVAASLGQVGVHTAAGLQALLVARDADLRGLAGAVEPMTLDRPVLELRAPFSYLSGYSTEVLAWAARPGFAATLPSASRARAEQVRALLTRFLQELPAGWSAAAAAYGRALLALPAAGG
jgi:spermidine synthase